MLTWSVRRRSSIEGRACFLVGLDAEAEHGVGARRTFHLDLHRSLLLVVIVVSMVGWCVSVVLEGVTGGGGGGVRHGHEHLLECRRAWGSTLERPVRLARLVDRHQSTPGILTACRRVSIAINTIIDCYNSRPINHKSLQFCLEIRN